MELEQSSEIKDLSHHLKKASAYNGRNVIKMATIVQKM